MTAGCGFTAICSGSSAKPGVVYCDCECDRCDDHSIACDGCAACAEHRFVATFDARYERCESCPAVRVTLAAERAA